MKLKTLFLNTILLSTLNLSATSLQDSVRNTINTNPDILAEHYNKKSFRTNIQEQMNDYRPTLDLETFIESSHTYNQPEDAIDNDAPKDGWDAKLKFEQVLYDGGLTPNEVDAYKFEYNSIKYTSKVAVENLILDVINAYTKLVSFQELMELDKVKIAIHERYLVQAKEKEEISGEILDSFQVSSKIKSIMDDFLKQEVDQQKEFSTYKKLSGNDLTGNICRPIIYEDLIPVNIEEAIKIAIRNNDRIKSQHAIIRQQKARVRIEEAKNRPTLKFQAEASFDNDIDLPENGQQDIYRLRLQSDWNLYNGGKDSVTHQREKIAILQEQKILDAITNEVIDEIKGSFNTYYKIIKRIKNMKSFVADNKAIVQIYNKQLEDGSRTFLDLLNAEAELFRTKILLIEIEFSLYDEYYNILRSLNILSDSLLNRENQTCQKYILDTSELMPDKQKVKEEEEKNLEDELGLD